MICGIVSQGVIRPCQRLLEMMFEWINSYIALCRHPTSLVVLGAGGTRGPKLQLSTRVNTRILVLV